MALAKENENELFDNLTRNDTFVPKIAPDTYNHSLNDHRQIPLDSLLTSIDGFSWTIDYYSQVLGSDEVPQKFQPSQASPHQQYLHIRSYDLKLQGELSHQFDSNQNRLKISGEAVLYPGFIPNVGDIVVGDIGDGTIMWFSVTQTTQLSYFKKSLWRIEFENAGVLTDRINEILQKKVVRRAVFDSSQTSFGKLPILTEEEYSLNNDLNRSVLRLGDIWIHEFYNQETGTVLVPHSTGIKVFDPLVTIAMIKLYADTPIGMYNKINLYNTESGLFENTVDIWTVLLRKQTHLLPFCCNQYKLVDSSKFGLDSVFEVIKYSAIDLVVMPVNKPHEYNDQKDMLPLPGGGFLPTNPDQFTHNINLKQNAIPMTDLTKGNYVFSDNVYKLNNSPTITIENLVRDHLQSETINLNVINRYINNIDKFTPLERFYLIPTMAILILDYLRGS